MDANAYTHLAALRDYLSHQLTNIAENIDGDEVCGTIRRALEVIDPESDIDRVVEEDDAPVDPND